MSRGLPTLQAGRWRLFLNDLSVSEAGGFESFEHTGNCSDQVYNCLIPSDLTDALLSERTEESNDSKHSFYSARGIELSVGGELLP